MELSDMLVEECFYFHQNILSFDFGAPYPSKKTDAMKNKAMVNLIQADHKSALDLQLVMKYRLTHVSLSLFHLDGTIKNPMKCNLLWVL